jgi:hypothetical protein
MATAFIAHSFSPEDTQLVATFREFIASFGLTIETGESPLPIAVSDKVKARVLNSDLFIAIFSRRKANGTAAETSPWLLEEKTFAQGAGKPILLFVEDDVSFFSGLSPDHEYIRFSRDALSEALVRAVPYVLSAVKAVSSDLVAGTAIDAIDQFEAQRLIAKMEMGGRLSATQDEATQNAVFRQALIGFAAVELQGNYSAFLFLLRVLAGRGYSIHPVSRLLFDKYHKMGLQAEDDTRLALRSGIKL